MALSLRLPGNLMKTKTNGSKINFLNNDCSRGGLSVLVSEEVNVNILNILTVAEKHESKTTKHLL